ncbi:MAG TPA: ATP-binding protein [Acidobacteriaceae bacterium]
MGTMDGRRRAIVIALGVCVLLLFLGLAALNAFNPRYLNPGSLFQTAVFVALSTLAFLLFIVVLVLLVRNVLKLYTDQRSRILGARLRTRMLWGAVMVSIVPLVFMYAFSYLLMNRAMERWFSQPVAQMRQDSDNMAHDLASYIGANARSEADSIAIGLSGNPVTPPSATRELSRHDMTLQGGFAIVYRDNRPVASLHVPQGKGPPGRLKSVAPEDTATDDAPTLNVPIETVPLSGQAQTAVLQTAQRNDGSVYNLGSVDYILATAGLKHGGIVVVGLPIPARIAAATASIRTADNAYQTLFRERRQVRGLYMVLLSLTSTLALFACCWLALNLSKQVTKPVESLADAMEAIAAGDYAHRVGESATRELGELVDSFNAMASDLESARAVAEQSTAQLSELNSALLARRTELETIIETIPNGVVTLSPARRIVLANRAFSETLDPGGQKPFVGLMLDQVFPGDVVEALDRLLRRSHRMGTASSELQMASPSGTLQLSATVAVLESGVAAERRHLGYVLVLEDVTQLLHAQKQSAWKEVARRVAHEIKNPLTPISLNAEQIHRHVMRLIPVLDEHGVESRSPAVIQRSSEIITASVETLRSLVDQFSALAEFPSVSPHPADLNGIVESALAMFAGRLGNIRVICTLATDLPPVQADPVALKRALSNLIDNAAEAMQDSLLRELQLETRMLESGMLELVVADTGPGVTDDMRERLFLPYFSTKQRGTGLGLSIASKIVQEHQGTIRVEKNVPAGAKFIVELRPAQNLETDAAETPAAPQGVTV